MTRFKPYPEYGDSGVDWLGNVPAEWSAKALRYLAVVETGSKDTVDADPDGEFPFIVRSPKPLRINTFSYDTEAILTAGDGDVGEIFHHMTGKFDAHQRVYVLRAFLDVEPRFLYYYLSSQFINVVAYGGIQTTVSSLRRPMFTSFPVLVPDRQTQRSIASFLDRETAEIDAFIADQEELIGLLAERRAATISHAVTKGLDPNVPMKDSGVEWLGAVPAHWGVRKLGDLFDLIGSGTTPPRNVSGYFGGTIPWVTTGELREARILKTKESVTEDAMRELSALRIYPRESLLIAMYGATVGRLGILGIEAATNQACCAFAYPKDVRSRFVYYALHAAKSHLLVIADGGGQPNINQEKLRQIRLPVPNLGEQDRLVDHLDSETAELDAAAADAREAISLSRERRAALISAAVTGKIDVREHGAVA